MREGAARERTGLPCMRMRDNEKVTRRDVISVDRVNIKIYIYIYENIQRASSLSFSFKSFKAYII